jgi:hypothetical protein
LSHLQNCSRLPRRRLVGEVCPKAFAQPVAWAKAMTQQVSTESQHQG